MSNKVIIIAEAGVNHNGDIGSAKKMIDVAAESGADIVKFQTFNVDALTSEYAPMADYQKTNMKQEISQKEMLKSLSLPYDDFEELAEYCDKIGIMFLSTPFDIDSIRFLDKLQDIWKVPSGEITNYPYLVEIAKTYKKVIMSTGMSTIEEVDEAVSVLKNNGSNDITLLHCTTEYPAPLNSVNLNAMKTLHEHTGCPVGYSDHTLGIEIPIAAAAMGACVIEKHFTLDRTMPGPDHKASLEPDELAEMVRCIRNIELAMGDGVKNVMGAERSNIAIARKSIVAGRDIKAGEVFSEENITTKRPGTGISPMRWREIIGKQSGRDYHKDELIEADSIK